jgi:hypothetical protein
MNIENEHELKLLKLGIKLGIQSVVSTLPSKIIRPSGRNFGGGDEYADEDSGYNEAVMDFKDSISRLDPEKIAKSYLKTF